MRSEGKTYLRDSVVFSSVNQEVLKTSELIWNESWVKLVQMDFSADHPKRKLIQGYGFETDQHLGKGTIKAIDAIILPINSKKEELP